MEMAECAKIKKMKGVNLHNLVVYMVQGIPVAPGQMQGAARNGKQNKCRRNHKKTIATKTYH
jgi:hypothetical protein